MPAGNSTTGVPRPKIGSVPYGQIIRSCNKKPLTVALTFGLFSFRLPL
jgi:hypothetical protein